MKLNTYTLAIIAVTLSFALADENYTYPATGSASIRMWTNTDTTGFTRATVDISTCFQYNSTAYWTTDQISDYEKRIEVIGDRLSIDIGASGNIDTTNKWKCIACFDASEIDAIAEGDTGVGGCIDYTATAITDGTAIPKYGTIEATGTDGFKGAEESGWGDGTETYTLTLSTGDSNLTAGSLTADSNSIDASFTTYEKESDDFTTKNLGFKLKYDRKVKCFAGDSADEPDWTAVSMSGWKTADAMYLDLAFLSGSYDYSFGIAALATVLALFF